MILRPRARTSYVTKLPSLPRRKPLWSKSDFFTVELTGRTKVENGQNLVEVTYPGYSDLWNQFRPQSEIQTGSHIIVLSEYSIFSRRRFSLFSRLFFFLRIFLGMSCAGQTETQNSNCNFGVKISVALARL